MVEERTLIELKLRWIPWTPTGHCKHTSYYDYTAPDRKYYTLSDHEDGSQCVDVYPSYHYMENWILLQNLGKRIKTYWFNK